MMNCGGYATAVSGVCTEPKQMANACEGKEPNGWEEINRRLEQLQNYAQETLNVSWAARVNLVGDFKENIKPDCPSTGEESAGDFIGITIEQINRIENAVAKVYADLVIIKRGRA